MAQQTTDQQELDQKAATGRKGHRGSRGIAASTGFDGVEKPDSIYVDLAWPLENDLDAIDPRYPLADRIFVSARTAIRVDDIQSLKVPNPTSGKKKTVKVVTFCLVSDPEVAYTVKYGTLGYALGIFKNEDEDEVDTTERTFGDTTNPAMANALGAALESVATGEAPALKAAATKVKKATAKQPAPTSTAPASKPSKKKEPTLADLMKIEAGAVFVAEQPILNLRTGDPIVEVGQEFKVIEVIDAAVAGSKSDRVVIELDGKQHNVAYGAVFRCIREPREGDSAPAPKPVTKHDSLAIVAGAEHEVKQELRYGVVGDVIAKVGETIMIVGITEAPDGNARHNTVTIMVNGVEHKDLIFGSVFKCIRPARKEELAPESKAEESKPAVSATTKLNFSIGSTHTLLRDLTYRGETIATAGTMFTVIKHNKTASKTLVSIQLADRETPTWVLMGALYATCSEQREHEQIVRKNAAPPAPQLSEAAAAITVGQRFKIEGGSLKTSAGNEISVNLRTKVEVLKIAAAGVAICKIAKEQYGVTLEELATAGTLLEEPVAVA